MTIDKPNGQQLKRLTNAIIKSGFAGNFKELIKAADLISERSTLKSHDVDAAYIEFLSLFYERMEGMNAGDRLKERFANDIRSGSMDQGKKATSTYDILKAHTLARLEISNPTYKGD